MAVRKSVFWIGAAWALLVFHRLFFALVFWRPDTSPSLAIDQWLFGLRFDLATIPVLVPVLLLLPMYWLCPGRPALRHTLRLSEALQWLLLGFAHLCLFASAFNYVVNDKHLGWEFYAYFSDLPTLMQGSWQSNPWLFLIYIAQIPAWIGVGYWWVYRRVRARHADHSTGAPKRFPPATAAALHFLATVLFLIVALRGGFQQSPLRPPDAMRHDSAYLNNLPLNGAFTISRDQADREADFRKYNDIENIRRVQELIDAPERFASEKYPLLRYMPANEGASRRPNVVILILESFTAKYLTEHGGDPRIAPEMQRLINGGRYYRRFFSTGGRSANGIYAIFGGLPDRASRTILRSTEIHNRLGGMASILGDLGYHSLFIYGGDLSFDNLDSFVPRAGFQRTISDREMRSQGLRSEGTAWGLDDRDTLRVLEQNLDRMPQPFLAALFTLNTHHPYLQPPDGRGVFGEETAQAAYLNSYRYSDRLIGEFIERMRTRAYFSNTIFVFVADHAHHTDLNYLEDRHIPLLFYAPGRIAPQRIDTIASQIDLLPSILYLCGGGGFYASMGRNLFDPRLASRDFAFYSGAQVIGWIEGDHLLIRWPSVKRHTLLVARHPASAQDYMDSHPELAVRYLENAERYYQFARTLQSSNRIWPSDSELARMRAQFR